MNEIKCPNCGKMFKISESDYDSIVKQIRDKEFNEEIRRNNELLSKEKESAIKIATDKVKSDLEHELSKKDLEINDLKNKVTNQEKEIVSKLDKEHLEEISKLNLEVASLKSKLEKQSAMNELEVTKAISTKDKEIVDLKSKLEINNKEHELEATNIKESYEGKLKDKDEQIAYYKDLKARQSTKMVGETLEQHCSYEFNRLRPLFNNAYFEKDNDARTGSKGDFIFRDFDDDGNEIVSIMFEMKNECDTTSTKHKNEDFLKELDKDRNEKSCEYAVLVSLLEIDSEFYNDGIVDMSHKYPKMYVIRPQFFIPLITLIRNLSLKSVEYRKELEMVKNQHIDITHFEDNMNKFKEGFGRNYRLATERFNKAIEEIDKTIDHLLKTKENLLKTNDNLRLANNKAEDLTLNKLVSHNETMKEMFRELKEENN